MTSVKSNIKYLDCNSSTILITFSPMSTPFGKFTPFKAVNDLPYDKLRIRSANKDWYSPFCISKKKNLEDIILKFAQKKEYKKIVTYGGSMGGYASIDFGLRINADVIISCGAESLFGYKNTFSEWCIDKNIAKILNHRINEWAELAKKNENRKIFSIYSVNNIKDIFNSIQIQRKCGINPTYWECEHSVPTYIHDNYNISDFIKNIIEFGDDEFLTKNTLKVNTRDLKDIVKTRHLWRLNKKHKKNAFVSDCVHSQWHYVHHLHETNRSLEFTRIMSNSDKFKSKVDYFWIKTKSLAKKSKQRFDFVESEYTKNQNKIGIKLQYIQELLDWNEYSKASILFSSIDVTTHPWAKDWITQIESDLHKNLTQIPTCRPKSKSILPDFLCIGAQKAGTSWLFANLNKNPNIWMPPVKELHFFDHLFCPQNRSWTTWHIQKAVDKLVRKECAATNINFEYVAYLSRLASKNLFSPEWYERAFSFNTKASVTRGDITPEYSTIPEEGIIYLKKYLNTPKIIYIIRDPFSRVCSQLLMNAKFSGFSKDTSKEKWTALAKSPDIATRGDYATYIPRWKKHFPEEKLLFIPFGLLNQNSTEFVRRIESFLGVPHISQDEVIQEKIWSSEKLPIPSTVSEYLQEITRPQYEFLISYFDKSFTELL